MEANRQQSSPIEIRSHDRALRMRLQPTTQGLCVMRARVHRELRARLLHHSVFLDLAAFEEWLAADSIRFDYPDVHAAVRRHGVAMFDALRRSV
jgi:hypothetical protein